MKKSRKILIASIVFVLSGAAFAGYTMIAGAQTDAEVKATGLYKSNLTRSVTASGKIETGTVKNVYATEAYPIKAILVEKGDIVKTGDILAELDTEAIMQDILQTELNIAKIENSLKTEQQAIEDNIVSSKNAVVQAGLTLEKQRLSYDFLKASYDGDTRTEIVSAKNSLQKSEENAFERELDLHRKTKEYEKNEVLYQAGVISKETLDNLEIAKTDAEREYQKALDSHRKEIENLELTQKQLQQELDLGLIDLQNAQQAYQNAETSFSQAQSKSTAYASELESQQLTLQNLNRKLEKAKIIAPSGGVITQVNASEGAQPTGILFVIEDLNDLFVNVNIKEYDIGNVFEGQEVVIKTEGSGDTEIRGTVGYVSRSAKKQGSTDDSNVLFEAHINITEPNPALYIGMNARTNIILDRREDVYAVYFDTVVKKEDGQSVIFTAEDGIAKEIPVTTAFETDTSIEIISQSGELRDGLMVISNPSGLKDGDRVSVKGGTK